MKERPILFSAPMVMAILEGRKTQTLRGLKAPFWTRAGPGYSPLLECSRPSIALLGDQESPESKELTA